MSIASAVARYCEKRGITVSEFERACGLTQGIVRKWEKHSPTLANIERISAGTGLTVAYWVREAQKSA